MSDPRTSNADRGEPGRYMLLPEDPAVAARAADPRRPRVRRYRLARLAVDGGPAAGEPARRPAGEFGYLRRPHD
jgi:hypothetical protein